MKWKKEHSKHYLLTYENEVFLNFYNNLMFIEQANQNSPNLSFKLG